MVTLPDGRDRIPDDGVLEEATVAVTSSMLLKGTPNCTLTLGMFLFGPTLSWPLKAPPWTSGRTKLEVADPLLRHSEEEEQERQVLYLSIASFFIYLSYFQLLLLLVFFFFISILIG